MKLVLRPRNVSSKMMTTQILRKNKLLGSYIPDTRWLDDDELKKMLSQYSTVFIKPDKGDGKVGSIYIAWLEGLLECTSGHGRKKLLPLQGVGEWIQDRLQKNKRYILQEGVHLATLQGGEFTFGVHMEKQGMDWKMKRLMVKIMGPVSDEEENEAEYTQATVNEIFHNKEEALLIVQELYLLAKEVGRTLSPVWKGVKEFIIEVGMDEEYNLWILEVSRLLQQDLLGNESSSYKSIKKTGLSSDFII